MNKTKQLQKQHEKAVADEFINHYYHDFIFSRFGNDQNESDILYAKINIKTKQEELLGIEVTDIWYRNIDAEQVWTAVRKERTPLRVEKSCGGLIRDIKNTLLSRIVERLRDKFKTKTKYQFSYKNILILDHSKPVQSPLTEVDDIKYCISEIQNKIRNGEIVNNNFAEVYIYYSDREFYKIYPL